MLAAESVRRDSGFILVTFADAITINGIEDAMGSASVYKEVDADVIFAEALKNIGQMKLVN